ncbi:UbiA family prenyltransferase [Streptacidiphilus jiangxiensis]|uniref:4-hydroxybenzoate polyprenyltransferase n=1 Tax=Streptacidiphilus jiangxiensis TaxID=235985 RepID=A0A1H7I0L4_STRJI|nr:UbiA family prenyltransferase [Streptacidiphilus jiangxiensis]SEK56049.1 4-hydroxybenzoate polyprenyltransferase [Streptacidiphilus jiangxiensis]
MMRRWARFVAGSYPPLPSVLFALAWAFGVTGLFAAVQPHSPPWRPGLGTADAALTLTVTLLMMRAVDDIRDLDYDRRHSPRRPLASGAVSIRDVLTLCAVGSVVVLALNVGNPVALVAIGGQLAYCALVLAAHHWWRWPSGDKLLLNLAVGFPAQLLLHLYLYARYLNTTSLNPGRHGVLAVVIVVLASVHLELAKKITRRREPGERSYVDVFGLSGTIGIALVAPLLSTVLLVTGARSTPALVPLAVLPLVLPALAGWRFWRKRTSRWSPVAPALYLLLTFTGYFALSLSY